MHLKNPLLFGLMAVFLLGGTISPAIGQSSTNLEIVINEFELNPSFSGSQEFVELYNPTSEDIDISGWEISPTATWKAYEIPENTILESKSFLAFTHVNFWFKDFGDMITLIDNLGNTVDETPLLTDDDGDARSWQRTTDGKDTNSISDWELKRYTPKSSNGVIPQTQESIFTLNSALDNSEYTFGDKVTISGNISEKLFTSLSSPEIIKISVKGPSYFKNLALFSDRNLDFSTTLDIQKVLGFSTGDYVIDISYGDYQSSQNFSILDNIESTSETSTVESLEIFTDKESYIPGETVVLFANTNSSIEYGGLDYTVTNPDGDVVFEGTIFQNDRFSTVFQSGGSQIYPFSTQFFMSLVNPVFGTYEIEGVYKSQNTRYYSSESTLETSGSFNLVKEEKEDVLISISTDKEIYSVGDVIKITGRSNQVWVEDLELQVMQTGIMNPESIGSDSRYVAPDPFNLKDAVRLNGDGTFEFEFKLIENFNSEDNYGKWYGDYKVIVSEYFGDGITSFKVVENPESFTDIQTPLNLKSDSSEYVLGSEFTLSGIISDYDFKINDNLRNMVEVTFSDSTGNVITYQDHQQRTGYTNCATNDCGKYDVPLTFKAFPDSVGSFQINVVLNPIQFEHGTYTATTLHSLSGIKETFTFDIISAQSEIVSKTEAEDPLTLEICKSNRAHVDEILKDLRSIGKGEIPPTMESVICGENLTFNVGDKLVVIGKVIPKTGVELDQSSTKTSGQTQGGSSYSTNFAESIMNYVEVSIPYPRTMTVTGAASVTTVPDANENYTGGGGSGEGGSYYEDEDGNIIRGGTEYCESYREDCTDREESKRNTGYDGTIIMKEQKLLLTDMRYKAYPDADGNYATVFELRAGVFKDGIYAVKADYFGYHDETSVKITDSSLKGGLVPSISVNLEKDEFVSGDTVRISGKINNIYYYDSVSVKVDTPDVSKINCFDGAQCGFGNSEKKIRVQEGVNGPTFFWNYKLPSDAALGLYTIIADTHFGEFKKQFFVVDESEVIGNPVPETETTISKKIIEKFNRIADNKIPIILTEKSSGEIALEPRVIQGSLFTSARGEESDVNLRITTSGGQCVIGQSSDCLVTESTRKPGAIYSIVTIDDINYKIRYSGDDVRLEKFSIVPEDSTSKIDIDNWNVEIIKDEQPSRFYYKVSYVALE